MKTNLRKSHLALAVLAAIPAFYSPVLLAQSATEAKASETEVIEVKGFRSSIIKAKDLKREA